MLCSDLRYAENMTEFMHYDNCHAVTIKPSCENWYGTNRSSMEARMETYFKKLKIDYALFPENPDGNLHYHGVIVTPTQKHYDNFRRWFNRLYGFIHTSVKLKTPDGHMYNNGWEQYCKKFINNCPQTVDNKVYMF